MEVHNYLVQQGVLENVCFCFLKSPANKYHPDLFLCNILHTITRRRDSIREVQDFLHECVSVGQSVKVRKTEQAIRFECWNLS